MTYDARLCLGLSAFSSMLRPGSVRPVSRHLSFTQKWGAKPPVALPSLVCLKRLLLGSPQRKPETGRVSVLKGKCPRQVRPRFEAVVSRKATGFLWMLELDVQRSHYIEAHGNGLERLVPVALRIRQLLPPRLRFPNAFHVTQQGTFQLGLFPKIRFPAKTATLNTARLPQRGGHLSRFRQISPLGAGGARSCWCHAWAYGEA